MNLINRCTFACAILLLCACGSETDARPDAGARDGSTAADVGTLPQDGSTSTTDMSTVVIDAGPVTNPALHTESEVCARWNADRMQDFEGTWSGQGDPICDAGDMDADWRSRTLTQVNLMRWLAGLPPVTFESSRNMKAQECALIQSGITGLTHTPTASNDCYSEEGAEGCSHSNISSSMAVHAVESYMIDRGDTNMLSLGHRRWILDNSVGPFGVGSTATKSCLWVIGGSGGADYEYAMWPPPGPVPLEAFYISHFGDGRALGLKDSAWSIQSPTVSFDGASVTVTDETGTVLPTRGYVLSGTYGVAHAFGMEPLDWDVDTGHTYHVQITGTPTPIVYDVVVVGCGTTIGTDT